MIRETLSSAKPSAADLTKPWFTKQHPHDAFGPRRAAPDQALPITIAKQG